MNTLPIIKLVGMRLNNINGADFIEKLFHVIGELLGVFTCSTDSGRNYLADSLKLLIHNTVSGSGKSATTGRMSSNSAIPGNPNNSSNSLNVRNLIQKVRLFFNSVFNFIGILHARRIAARFFPQQCYLMSVLVSYALEESGHNVACRTVESVIETETISCFMSLLPFHLLLQDILCNFLWSTDSDKNYHHHAADLICPIIVSESKQLSCFMSLLPFYLLFLTEKCLQDILCNFPCITDSERNYLVADLICPIIVSESKQLSCFMSLKPFYIKPGFQFTHVNRAGALKIIDSQLDMRGNRWYKFLGAMNNNGADKFSPSYNYSSLLQHSSQRNGNSVLTYDVSESLMRENRKCYYIDDSDKPTREEYSTLASLRTNKWHQITDPDFDYEDTIDDVSHANVILHSPSELQGFTYLSDSESFESVEQTVKVMTESEFQCGNELETSVRTNMFGNPTSSEYHYGVKSQTRKSKMVREVVILHLDILLERMKIRKFDAVPLCMSVHDYVKYLIDMCDNEYPVKYHLTKLWSDIQALFVRQIQFPWRVFPAPSEIEGVEYVSDFIVNKDKCTFTRDSNDELVVDINECDLKPFKRTNYRDPPANDVELDINSKNSPISDFL